MAPLATPKQPGVDIKEKMQGSLESCVGPQVTLQLGSAWPTIWAFCFPFLKASALENLSLEILPFGFEIESSGNFPVSSTILQGCEIRVSSWKYSHQKRQGISPSFVVWWEPNFIGHIPCSEFWCCHPFEDKKTCPLPLVKPISKPRCPMMFYSGS